MNPLSLVYLLPMVIALWRSDELQSTLLEILKKREHQRGNINDGVNGVDKHWGIDSSLQFVQPTSEWHLHLCLLEEQQLHSKLFNGQVQLSQVLPFASVVSGKFLQLFHLLLFLLLNFKTF